MEKAGILNTFAEILSEVLIFLLPGMGTLFLPPGNPSDISEVRWNTLFSGFFCESADVLFGTPACVRNPVRLCVVGT